MVNEIDIAEQETNKLIKTKEYFKGVADAPEDNPHLWQDLHLMCDNLLRLQRIKKTLKEYDTILTKLVDIYRINKIPAKMAEEKVERVSYSGIGNIRITNDMRVSIRASRQEDAFLWLSDNGLSDIIKETVNSNTLRAVAKDLIKNKNESLPDDLFNTYCFERASITQA